MTVSDRLKRASLLVAVLITCALSISAQDTVTGGFKGIVRNSQTGGAIKGASIEIINQQTGVSFKITTDYQGRFYQGLLLPGVYLIRVSMPNFQTKEVNQRLRITYTGQVVPVPVDLDPAPPTAAAPPPAAVVPVEDTDIRASVVTTDGRRSGSFSEDEVVSLPVGSITVTRTFDELALLLPGVAAPPQTLGSVSGPGVGAGVGSAGQFAVLERIKEGTPVAGGQRIRLSIESLSREGYLYVIDREQYSDGTFGEPLLIFPTSRTSSASDVKAGHLVYIPSVKGRFNIKPSKSGKQQVAEVLTVIISPQPLIAGDKLQTTAIRLAAGQVESWEKEFGAKSTTYEVEGGAGRAMTEKEQAAGVKAIEFTQDDPPPQTVHRVTTKPDAPLLIKVSLPFASS
jgi:hypothetical protein